MRTPEGWASAYLERGRVTGKSPSWSRGTRRVLGGFLARAPRDLCALTEEDVLGDLALLSHLSPATKEARLGVLRGFFRFLAREGEILFNPAQTVRLGKHARGRRRAPSMEHVEKLLSSSATGPRALRDQAVLEVLYSSGLRRQELCGLDLGDADLAGGTFRVRNGKGGKERIVPAGARALVALRRYLEKGRPSFKPRTPALFVNKAGGRLSAESVHWIVRERSRVAGLETLLSPHLLRHAFATHLLENGASIRHVQAMLGHAEIGSTQVYTHVSAQRLRDELDRAGIRESLEREPAEDPSPGLGRFSL